MIYDLYDLLVVIQRFYIFSKKSKRKHAKILKLEKWAIMIFGRTSKTTKGFFEKNIVKYYT